VWRVPAALFSLGFCFTAEVDRPEVAKNNEELPYLGAIFLWIGATPFLLGLVCFTGVVGLKQNRGMWQDSALIDS
jgi:hypothetical protein